MFFIKSIRSIHPKQSKLSILFLDMSTALECLRQLNIINEEISIPRILYGVVLTLISVVSIVMNTLILLIIFSTDAMDRLFRFYLLSATLGGLIEVVPILSALTPAILFNVHLNDPTNVIISTTDTLGYLTLMMTTTAIATDRFVFFMLPKVSTESMVEFNIQLWRNFPHFQ